MSNSLIPKLLRLCQDMNRFVDDKIMTPMNQFEVGKLYGYVSAYNDYSAIFYIDPYNFSKIIAIPGTEYFLFLGYCKHKYWPDHPNTRSRLLEFYHCDKRVYIELYKDMSLNEYGFYEIENEQ